jgi:ectoine hydroxylase-related dioxygenase (phytanoyl-CoA dioxygenase family)
VNLTPDQVEFYHQNGYLRLERVLDPEEDLRPVIEAYEQVIDQRARRLYGEGKISSLYEGESFGGRLAKMAAEAPEAAAALDIYSERRPAMFRFLCNPKIHDVIAPLIGSEILCHPCQHLRVVVPTSLTSLSRTTGWHQDAGVLWPEADDHLIVTTWIPLLDVDIENGCLEVVPRSHTRGLLPHTAMPGARVPEDALPNDLAPQPLPLPAGGMILFHNYVLHRARPNVRDTIRWSMDLRWQDPALPTGRPFYPGFIVRSRLRPETVQYDYDQWRERWEFALAHTKGVPVNRFQAAAQPA